MDLSKFFEELLVVIVLFRQKPQESAAYTSLYTALSIFPSFPEIFIYDNSPQPSPIESIHITYVHDPVNSGVSRAYNQAAMFAAAKNKKWLFLLDQDTTVGRTLFEKWGHALRTHPDSLAFVPIMKDRIGVVSPFYFSSGRGRRTTVVDEMLPLRKYRFINSGLLIRQAAFRKTGGYDEDVPLDFSDIAFGERLRKITDHFVVVSIALEHGFSATSDLPLNDALVRFRHFCRGTLVMGKKSGRPYLYFIRAFFHAAHLTFDYKSAGFIKILLKNSVHG